MLGAKGKQQVVKLDMQADSVIYGRDIVHSRRAVGETIILTVGFLLVEI